MFCSHKFQTAVGQFLENKKEMVVLKCDKCGKYEVLSNFDMQVCRHTFLKSVDVRKISMYMPYVPCNASEFAVKTKEIISSCTDINNSAKQKLIKEIDELAAEFGAEVE